MYFKSERGIYATYFINTNQNIKNTDTMLHGTISVREQIGGFGDDEESKYEFQSWNAVFLGKKSAVKAAELPNKTMISIKACDFRNHYDKERNKSYPEIRILDFDIKERQAD